MKWSWQWGFIGGIHELLIYGGIITMMSMWYLTDKLMKDGYSLSDIFKQSGSFNIFLLGFVLFTSGLTVGIFK